MHIAPSFVLAVALWLIASIIAAFSPVFLWGAPLIISGLALLFCAFPAKRKRCWAHEGIGIF